jgi:hypothetical protein
MVAVLTLIAVGAWAVYYRRAFSTRERDGE